MWRFRPRVVMASGHLGYVLAGTSAGAGPDAPRLVALATNSVQPRRQVLRNTRPFCRVVPRHEPAVSCDESFESPWVEERLLIESENPPGTGGLNHGLSVMGTVAAGGRTGGQAAGSRVTLYPRASSCRMWLRFLRSGPVRLS